MTEDIEGRTKIVDPKTSQKTYGGQKDVALKLISWYQVYQAIERIDEESIDWIMDHGRGNPLLSFHFTFTAIVQGFLSVEDKVLRVTNRLRFARKYADRALLKVPYVMYQKNQVILRDQLAAARDGLA